MRSFLRLMAFIAATAASCAVGFESVSKDLPIYPYWDRIQMPDGPAAGSDRMPLPTASAVLVAPGYLVTTAEYLGTATLDVRDSEVVYLFDGKDWHVGRYVDFDSSSNLALIRADVPGTPLALAQKNLGPLRLMGIPWDRGLDRPIVREEYLLPACRGQPDILGGIMGEPVRVKSYCFQGWVKTLSGGAFIDGEGRLGGVQVNSTGAQYHSGSGAAEIRTFIETYFASWGRDVKNKPKL